VAPSDISDQIFERLWHSSARQFAKEIEYFVLTQARVEPAADGGIAEPIDPCATCRFDVGEQGESAGSTRLEWSRSDGGQIGLQQYVRHWFRKQWLGYRAQFGQREFEATARC
jgi:hypothetical protein